MLSFAQSAKSLKGYLSDMALEAACRKVIDRARQSNTEIVIWRAGEIVELSPDEASAELEANLAKRHANNPS